MRLFCYWAVRELGYGLREDAVKAVENLKAGE